MVSEFAAEGVHLPLPIVAQLELESSADAFHFVAVIARGALLAVHIKFALLSALFTWAAEAVDSLPANFVDVCSKPADLESLAAVFDGTIFSAGHPVVSLVTYRTFNQHTFRRWFFSGDEISGVI